MLEVFDGNDNPYLLKRFPDSYEWDTWVCSRRESKKKDINMKTI